MTFVTIAGYYLMLLGLYRIVRALVLFVRWMWINRPINKDTGNRTPPLLGPGGWG